jgi:hypothetical protein
LLLLAAIAFSSAAAGAWASGLCDGVERATKGALLIAVCMAIIGALHENINQVRAMTNAEFKKRIYELRYIAEVNLRYHQLLEWRWGAADKSVKVAVMVLAIAGTVLAAPKLEVAGIDIPMTGFVVAILSLLAAAVLNIAPVGDRQTFHGKLFQLWGNLLREASALETTTCEKDVENAANHHHCNRLIDLLDTMRSLDTMEPAPWGALLLRCQEDQNEKVWGAGIRTNEQIETERTKRIADNRPTLAT